jgi:multisubunit Na+/H+ antiporter MnhC subunit
MHVSWSFVCFLNIYFIFIITYTRFKLLDAQVAETHRHVHIQMEGYYYTSTTTPPPYAVILFGLIIVLAVQFLMLSSVLRCRQFLSAKQEHEMAMKVAEMSVCLLTFFKLTIFSIFRRRNILLFKLLWLLHVALLAHLEI